MARITRMLQKIFGLSGNNGIVGSAQASGGTLSQDLSDLQSLGAFSTGFTAVVESGKKLPPLEEMQSLSYIATTQLAYLFQEGIPEYDATTTYFTNSIVKQSSSTILYRSLTNTNLGNALTDIVNWQKCGDLLNLSVTPTAQQFNAIINGDFNIWQRGTSFSAVASGTYTADRFRYDTQNTTAIHTISQSTDVPTVIAAGRLYNYSLSAACTTADASVGSTDFVSILQVIEGYNWLPLAQQVITLSFWVKDTKTGIHCTYLTGGGKSYVAEYTVNLSDTWEYKTITFSASPSTGSWNYTNQTGVILGFPLMVGSSRQTTGGSWQTGDFEGTSNIVNSCDSTSNVFKICGTQLQIGSIVTALQNKTIDEELLSCRRYFERLMGDATSSVVCSGFAVTTTSAYGVLNFSLKRILPTLSVDSNTHFQFSDSTGANIASGIAFALPSKTNARIALTVTGAIINNPGDIETNTTGYIDINAEFS